MPEAVGLTVHSLPAPELVRARAQRRRNGRQQLLLVMLACLAPVLASYLAYHVLRPEGRTNYAELVDPPREWPADMLLTTLDGDAVTPQSLQGQWLLVLVMDAACDRACEQRVYLQRQLREMLGKERDRVERIWLLRGQGQPRAELLQAASATPGLRVLRADGDALAAWLEPSPGQPLTAQLYIVDPMGLWMMRAPVDPDPSKLKKDLGRLLRASAFWDRAGR